MPFDYDFSGCSIAVMALSTGDRVGIGVIFLTNFGSRQETLQIGYILELEGKFGCMQLV